MLKLRLNITKSKIIHSYQNNMNIKYKVFISNRALLKTIICLVNVQKQKHYSFLILARRTYRRHMRKVGGDKLDLLSFLSVHYQ